jgi:hypothetical protein
VEIAAAVKQAIRPTGMSREQIVDAINVYSGRTDEGAASDPPACCKPLTIHMLKIISPSLPSTRSRPITCMPFTTSPAAWRQPMPSWLPKGPK